MVDLIEVQEVLGNIKGRTIEGEKVSSEIIRSLKNIYGNLGSIDFGVISHISVISGLVVRYLGGVPNGREHQTLESFLDSRYKSGIEDGKKLSPKEINKIVGSITKGMLDIEGKFPNKFYGKDIELFSDIFYLFGEIAHHKEGIITGDKDIDGSRYTKSLLDEDVDDEKVVEKPVINNTKMLNFVKDSSVFRGVIEKGLKEAASKRLLEELNDKGFDRLRFQSTNYIVNHIVTSLTEGKGNARLNELYSFLGTAHGDKDRTESDVKTKGNPKQQITTDRGAVRGGRPLNRLNPVSGWDELVDKLGKDWVISDTPSHTMGSIMDDVFNRYWLPLVDEKKEKLIVSEIKDKFGSSIRKKFRLEFSGTTKWNFTERGAHGHSGMTWADIIKHYIESERRRQLLDKDYVAEGDEGFLNHVGMMVDYIPRTNDSKGKEHYDRHYAVASKMCMRMFGVDPTESDKKKETSRKPEEIEKVRVERSIFLDMKNRFGKIIKQKFRLVFSGLTQWNFTNPKPREISIGPKKDTSGYSFSGMTWVEIIEHCNNNDMFRTETDRGKFLDDVGKIIDFIPETDDSKGKEYHDNLENKVYPVVSDMCEKMFGVDPTDGYHKVSVSSYLESVKGKLGDKYDSVVNEVKSKVDLSSTEVDDMDLAVRVVSNVINKVVDTSQMTKEEKEAFDDNWNQVVEEMGGSGSGELAVVPIKIMGVVYDTDEYGNTIEKSDDKEKLMSAPLSGVYAKMLSKRVFSIKQLRKAIDEFVNDRQLRSVTANSLVSRYIGVIGGIR